MSVGTANASTWQTYRYSYRDDSNLIETLAVENKPFVVARTYEEDRDLLTSIETKSTSPSTVYTKFSYTYDARRYRSTALQEGTAFADYGDATYRQFAYNGRGELTAGIAYLGTNVASQAAPLPGRRHEYAYDNLGNRQWSNSTGVSALRDDYSANALNQYVSRENNTVSISGTAATDSVVAVKGRNVTAGRQGRFWSDEVTVSNVLGPWTGPLSVYANKTVGGSSVMRIDSRSAAIPAVAQTLTYDLDGNTLSDGLWDYQWDAENRLVRLETAVAARSAGIAHRIINFTYDYLGRRVQKQVIDGVTVTELSSARFIYNRWDIIAEYSVLNGSTLDKLQRTYAWGVDIAGSLSDAGGVGALLQFANSTTGTAFMPSYDGNGNIASLINLGSGALAAAFEYSPFGEMLRDEILDNTVATSAFGFSTKWRDVETGWLNYGRRYYDPRNGRFIGRDPIAEKGGINLYAFCGNNSINRWDRLGMHLYCVEVYEGEYYCPDDYHGYDGIPEDNDVTGPYGTDPSQYFGTFMVTSTIDGSSGSASWIGVDGSLYYETFESPIFDPIEVPVPDDEYYAGDPSDGAAGGELTNPRYKSIVVDPSTGMIGQPNKFACGPTAAWNAAVKLFADKVNTPENRKLFDELATDALKKESTSLSDTAIAFNKFAKGSYYQAELRAFGRSQLENMIEGLSKGYDMFITTAKYENINHTQLYVPDGAGKFQVFSSRYENEQPIVETWTQDTILTIYDVESSQERNKHYGILLIAMPPP